MEKSSKRWLKHSGRKAGKAGKTKWDRPD